MTRVEFLHPLQARRIRRWLRTATEVYGQTPGYRPERLAS